MSVDPIYDVSSQDVGGVFNEADLLADVAQALAESLAKDLDPEGLSPTLANDIKSALDNDPDFYDNLAQVIYDNDDVAADAVNFSLNDLTAGVLGEVVPEIIKQSVKNTTEALQKASQAANDNIPKVYRCSPSGLMRPFKGLA